MSQQPENEALTPQELRETLLSEIEASQQAISELNDEQLEEITGGGFFSNLSFIRKNGYSPVYMSAEGLNRLAKAKGPR
jgi:hypothetical protein